MSTTTPLPLAGKRGGVPAKIDGEGPNLKLLGGSSLLISLRNGDFIQQPVGSTGIGDMLRAVREQHAAVKVRADTSSPNR